MWAVVIAIVGLSTAIARADTPLRLDSVRRIEWTHTATPSVPTRTSSGTPLRWAGSCVFVRPHATGPADVSPADYAAALELATAAWRTSTAACGYLRFQLEPAEAGEVGLDFVNRIVVREDTWCRPGPPAVCYDESALAITTVFFIDLPGEPSDGTIVDADIELNAVNFAIASCPEMFGTCVTSGSGLIADLANTLTHELGHVVGLDHSCWAGDPSSAPLDSEGNPALPCQPAANLPLAVREATMFPASPPEEIVKRTPESDDVGGFCLTYPVASDPGVCSPVTPPDGSALDGPPLIDDRGGCCKTSNADLGGLLALLVLLGRRRFQWP